MEEINRMSGVLYTGLMNTPGVAAYTSTAEFLDMENKFINRLKHLNDLSLQQTKIAFNTGIDPDLKQVIDDLSIFCGLFIPSLALNITATVVLGPILEFINSYISAEEAKNEINRFLKSTKDKSGFIEPSITSKPDSITYASKNGLPTIVANGKSRNIVTLGEGNNYIRAIDGDENVLDGQGGDDYIVGYDKRDTLIGGSGKDVLMGGKGDDTWLSDSGT